MHKSIELPIYYFGTPVVLISTLNEDGSTNIAPSSSIWCLGKSCMIGLDGSSKTTENLRRSKTCVLNMPSADKVDAVERIANATGQKSIPLHKKALGYRYVKDKAGTAGLTLIPSSKVKAPRIGECQVQLETSVAKVHPFSDAPVPMFAFELDILETHIEESILMGDKKSYVDPDAWHPLIMSFRKYYTTHNYIHPAVLETESIEKYRVTEPNSFLSHLVARSVAFLYRKYN